MAVSNKEDFGCTPLTMEAMSELVKVDSPVQTSAGIELLLQVPHDADAHTVKQIIDMPAHLTEAGSEVHEMENHGGGLPETMSEEQMEAGINITQESIVEHASAVAIQEISGLTGVDIITLQPSAQMQPMFQLVSSEDGTSYMQLSDNQMIQAVTSGEQGLQTVSLPSGVAALMEQESKQGSSLEGQAVQLDDGTTAIMRNIQPTKDHSMTTRLLEGQVIHLEDGTTGFIQAGLPGSDVQSLQLEDGSTAYISLFGEVGGGALSIDSNPPTQDMHTPLQVIGGEEEDQEEDIMEAEDESMVVANIKEEQMMQETSSPQNAFETSTVIADEEHIPSCALSSQPHVSYRALALGDKAYKCMHQGCGRLYTTQHHLKVHGRSHTGVKPFRCEFPGCGKAFATGYGLKSHTRVHTGEKPYRCTEASCNKGFKTSGDLQKHIRTHTGERPFKCPFEGCDRMFTTSNIRKVHIRTHTGERPYVCHEDGCKKSFASATNYKNHIRIHTGEKPYVCTVEGCGKRFTEYSSLYKHHVVHTQTKPYVCNHCHKTYRQTSTLAMHKRTIHNDISLDGDALLSSITGVQIVNPVGCSDRDSGDTEGALVINTSEAALIGAGGMINQAIPTLQAIPQGSSALLQHLQPAGITVQGAGIQQVYLIADPTQLETLKQMAAQQSETEDQGAKEGTSSENGPGVIAEPITTSVTTPVEQLIQGNANVLTVHAVSPPDDHNLVVYPTE